jgi:hypothetical protein
MTYRRKPKIYRADRDIKQLEDTDDISKVIEVYNQLAKQFNFLNKFISIQSNIDGYIANVTIQSGESLAIQHFLGVVPKWRIILKQEGNGVISDIPSGWNDKIITLKNNGSESVNLSVLIAKE